MKNLNIRMTKRTEETPFVKTASEAFRSPNIHWFSNPYCMVVAEQTKDIINASIYQHKGDPLQVRTLCDVIAAVAENDTLTVEHVTCGWRIGEGWETAVVRVWNLEAYQRQAAISPRSGYFVEDETRRQAVGPEISDFGSFSHTLRLWETPRRGVGQLMRDLMPFKRDFKKGADSPFAQEVVEATKSDLVCYSEPREMVEVIAHAEGRALLLVGSLEKEGCVSPLFLSTLIESLHNRSPHMRVKSCHFYDKQGTRGWKMVLLYILDEEWLRADIRAQRAAQSEREEQQDPLPEGHREAMRKIRQLLLDAGANPILNRDPDEVGSDDLFNDDRPFGDTDDLFKNDPADFESLCRHAFELFLQNPKRASISYLQRKFSIGYGKAAHIMDELEERGYVGASRGPNKPREILRDHWIG